MNVRTGLMIPIVVTQHILESVVLPVFGDLANYARQAGRFVRLVLMNVANVWELPQKSARAVMFINATVVITLSLMIAGIPAVAVSVQGSVTRGAKDVPIVKFINAVPIIYGSISLIVLLVVTEMAVTTRHIV